MSLQELCDAELRQRYANANETCGCIGHKKRARNQDLRDHYRKELDRRGVPVPTREEVPGIFNGVGSD